MVEVFGTILAVLLSENATPDPLNAKGLLMAGSGAFTKYMRVERGLSPVTIATREERIRWFWRGPINRAGICGVRYCILRCTAAWSDEGCRDGSVLG
jgi:hypothetical protein